MKLDPTTVHELARLADVLHARFGENETAGLEPVDADRLARYAADPTRAEMRALITSLSAEERAELIALTWIGRGDCGPEDFPSLARQTHRETAEGAAGYLIAKAPLGEYLRDGLREVVGA